MGSNRRSIPKAPAALWAVARRCRGELWLALPSHETGPLCPRGSRGKTGISQRGRGPGSRSRVFCARFVAYEFEHFNFQSVQLSPCGSVRLPVRSECLGKALACEGSSATAAGSIQERPAPCSCGRCQRWARVSRTLQG